MPEQSPRIGHATVGSVHLDALRGAAALLVFFSHTRALYFASPLQATVAGASNAAGQASSVPQAPSVEGFGQIKIASEAVVIFFVLSGYLVGGSVLRAVTLSRWSWSSYLSRRLTRLYIVLIPALILGALLDYAGSHLFGPGSVYTGPAGLELVTTVHLAERIRPAILLGNAFFLENFLVPYAGTNASLWSLANEFWYYLAFPLIVLAWTSRRNALFRSVCALLACGIFLFTGYHIAVLFPIWVMGALVSLLPRRLNPLQGRQLTLALLPCLLAAMFGVRLLHMQTVPAEYVVGAVASMLLYVIIQQTQPAPESVYKLGAGFFSRISYTLYLFHLPMAMFLCGVLNSPWHRWEKKPVNVLLFLVSEVAIVGCVTLLWRLFEANTDRVRELLFER